MLFILMLNAIIPIVLKLKSDSEDFRAAGVKARINFCERFALTPFKALGLPYSGMTIYLNAEARVNVGRINRLNNIKSCRLK